MQDPADRQLGDRDRFVRELFSRLGQIRSSRFIGWATIDPAGFSDEDVNGRGVVDFENHRLRAMYAGIAPVVLRHTESLRRPRPPGLALRVMRHGAKARDVFEDREAAWDYSARANSWHRDRHSDQRLPGWDPDGPMFLLEVLARLTDVADSPVLDQVHDVDAQRFDAHADLTDYLNEHWRHRPGWAQRSNRSFLSRVEVKVWLDDSGLLQRVSSAPCPAQGRRNPVFWRHVELFGFGAGLEIPELPVVPHSPSRPHARD